MVAAASVLCWRLPPTGLKLWAAKEAETVLAEEAALVAEVLADVALATTIATADADNSRQQTTINNRLGAAARRDMTTTTMATVYEMTKTTTKMVQRWRRRW